MILQLIVVLCDCIIAFQVSFVSVVCDRLMCAATELYVTCVLITMLIVLMSAKYRNRMYYCVLRPEKNATDLVMCTVLIVIMSVRCCNILYCDRSECNRVMVVYCVNNCDNVSKVLVLYVTLCIATEV